MIIRKLLYTLISLSTFFSCGVLPEQNSYETNSNTVELGVLGDKKKSVYITQFETAGIPGYSKFIKISLEEKNFTKGIYKEYQKAIKGQTVVNKIEYVDSLEIKPKFLNFAIEDKTMVIESLNSQDNVNVRNYIKNVPNTKIVTGLRIVASSDITQQLKKADALYFRTNQQKQQVIYLFKKEKQIGVLDLSKATAFGVKLSSFCWGITDTEKVHIATIMSDGENCTLKTNRDPKKLEKQLEKNYFKF
ncbi:hypothetical protein SAMN04489761_2358 [Tenacibaculum sp. MAR_2009_124]|uniref:hypothetical protein n=1 Tax=Tenacibaculum sp. MAR_2009_124 TaxID=1250059 RepID=UPI00089C952F|nr:hypothetical protein [Tenacibaculum sp. MAR_2009_124]SEC20006.1 hypothetical protein SAMN04489761_2358 [Tenacibaculum sp. MAR_2009_124]